MLSFSVYLLHRLVLHLVGGIVSAAPTADLLALEVTVAAAQLLYVGVEKPLGRLRKCY